MCGLVGFLGGYGVAPDVVTAMADRLHHRGPDDAGRWSDPAHGLALGHRRLAVVDLSPHGHQPMVSRCGRFVLVFNGEIYNARDLAERLGPVAWRGHSDTEVLLESIARHGVPATLDDLVGMFAFAVWDRSESTLILARDRLGEKPLYWGTDGGRLLFASELKALRAFPGFAPAVDADAVAEVLRRGYVPAPGTIYAGVFKLPPAHWLAVRCRQGGAVEIGEPQRYWRPDGANLVERRARQAARPDAALIDEVQMAIDRSVRGQMIADVPIGAFLSGGIDSSLVVASMQAQATGRVRTFTIGFGEAAYDEAPYAAAVAGHLGTDHTQLIVTPADAEAVIPRLAAIYDEPFADASQIPTVLVAHLTRQHVTVSLSGDGGDECFAGYSRYAQAAALWQRLGRRPRWLRAGVRGALRSASPAFWDGLLRLVPRRWGITGHRLHRLAEILAAEGSAAFYDAFMMQRVAVDGFLARPHAPHRPPCITEAASLLDVFRSVDLERYLPDDILVKVDRATMAASLESRAPLLDHRVAELAWSLPERVLRRGGQGKWILRQVLERRVPRELIDRPKAGFSLPVAEWLRGGLRDWAEALLAPAALARVGWLEPAPVQRLWRQHLAGTHDRQAQLWNILMLSDWLERARSRAGD